MKRTKLKKKVTIHNESNLVDRALRESENLKVRKLARQVEEDIQFAERRIIIGAITDTEFCRWCYENFNLRFFGSFTGKRIAGWVYDHFREYEEAPYQAIEDRFQEEMGNLPEDLIIDIEDILVDLSDEYIERPLSTRYLKQIASRYLNKRQVELRLNILDGSDLEDQLELLGIDPVNAETFEHHIQTLTELENEDVHPPKMLLSPWLREGETTILYSKSGVGKSLLAMLISHVLCCENYDGIDCEIADWQVRQPTGTLYIDGELGKAEVLERFRQFRWLGDQIKEYETKVLVRGDLEQTTEKTFSLGNKGNQQKIISFLKKNRQIKLVIIDSVSTLFDMENENDNSEWNRKINPFIRALRSLDVAHIIQHHAGKNNDLRGASAMDAMANNVLKLTNHQNKEPGSAWFKIENGHKQRAAGKLFDPFYLRFEQTFDGSTEFEITDNPGISNHYHHKKIKAAIIRGDKGKDIARENGITPARVSQLKKQTEKEGLLEDNNPTMEGVTFLKEMEEEWE